MLHANTATSYSNRPRLQRIRARRRHQIAIDMQRIPVQPARPVSVPTGQRIQRHANLAPMHRDSHHIRVRLHPFHEPLLDVDPPVIGPGHATQVILRRVTSSNIAECGNRDVKNAVHRVIQIPPDTHQQQIRGETEIANVGNRRLIIGSPFGLDQAIPGHRLDLQRSAKHQDIKHGRPGNRNIHVVIANAVTQKPDQDTLPDDAHLGSHRLMHRTAPLLQNPPRLSVGHLKSQRQFPMQQILSVRTGKKVGKSRQNPPHDIQEFLPDQQKPRDYRATQTIKQTRRQQPNCHTTQRNQLCPPETAKTSLPNSKNWPTYGRTKPSCCPTRLRPPNIRHSEKSSLWANRSYP